MSLIIYSDIVLPNSIIAAGVRGKSMRMNERTQNQGGFDQVNVQWQKTLRQYEIGIVPMLRDAWQSLEGLYEVTDAGAYGFLMEDPKDNEVLISQGLMQPVIAGVNVGAIGFGFGVPTYQLAKRYSVAGSTRTKDRLITRPKNSASLARSGSPIPIGVAAGSATVNYDTGLVTFVPTASQAITSITVGASTVLNFSGGTIVAAFTVGHRIYLNGVTGSAAAALNLKSHIITAKGASSITISTVTTGLTASGGAAAKFPQSTEFLAWSGMFYVPVHFANDDLDWYLARSGLADMRLMTGPSVLLIEVRE